MKLKWQTWSLLQLENSPILVTIMLCPATFSLLDGGFSFLYCTVTAATKTAGTVVFCISVMLSG